MLIKKIKRIGHGFRNLANYRLRLLLAVGLDWRNVHWLPPPPRSEAAHHAWWRRAMKADTPPRAPALFRFRLVPKLSAWRDRPASRRSSSSRVPCQQRQPREVLGLRAPRAMREGPGVRR